MTPLPRNPATGEAIHSLSEFDQTASTLANLAIHNSSIPLPEGSVAQTTTPSLGEELKARAESNRVSGPPAEEELQAALSEREDPYDSLGGGRLTYKQSGILPVAGETQRIREQVTHGRGGKPVTRLSVNGYFIDVPIVEGTQAGSHAQNLQKAREKLIQGKGVPVSRLKPSKKR